MGLRRYSLFIAVSMFLLEEACLGWEAEYYQFDRLTWSRDGTKLAFKANAGDWVDYPGFTRILDISTREFFIPDPGVMSFVLSPDGRQIVFREEYGLCYLKLQRGERPRRLVYLDPHANIHLRWPPPEIEVRFAFSREGSVIYSIYPRIWKCGLVRGREPELIWEPQEEEEAVEETEEKGEAAEETFEEVWSELVAPSRDQRHARVFLGDSYSIELEDTYLNRDLTKVRHFVDIF